MPRTARQTSTSGIYHIMLRGINRQDIFFMEQICGCHDSAQFQRQSFDRQRNILAEAATMGAAINQIARITGLSYRQVYKTVKKKNENQHPSV